MLEVKEGKRKGGETRTGQMNLGKRGQKRRLNERKRETEGTKR